MLAAASRSLAPVLLSLARFADHRAPPRPPVYESFCNASSIASVDLRTRRFVFRRPAATAASNGLLCSLHRSTSTDGLLSIVISKPCTTSVSLDRPQRGQSHVLTSFTWRATRPPRRSARHDRATVVAR